MTNSQESGKNTPRLEKPSTPIWSLEIDLSQFSLRQGQMLQGRASLHISVYDMSKPAGEEKVYGEDLPERSLAASFSCLKFQF